MESLSQTVIQEEWPKILKDWHIVVAIFYIKGETKSTKMLRQIKQEFEPALKEFPDTALITVPLPDNRELAEELNIRETPTLMIFHHREVVKRILKNPVSSQQRVDRIVTPYKVMGKDLLDLVADLHRIAKR